MPKAQKWKQTILSRSISVDQEDTILQITVTVLGRKRTKPGKSQTGGAKM